MAKATERRFLTEFIQIYRELPVLWQLSNKDYNSRQKKSDAYDILVAKYREYTEDANRDMVTRKINSLRTNYRKECRKIMQSRKFGCDPNEEYIPSLWYYKELKFLEKANNSNASTSEDYERDMENDLLEDSDYKSEPEKLAGPPSKRSRLVQVKKEPSTSMSLSPKPNRPPLNEYEILGSSWANELQKMSPQQQLFAKKAINDILFEGQLGTLQRDSLHINTEFNSATTTTTATIVEEYSDNDYK